MFEEYQLSSRARRGHVRRAAAFGLLATALTVALMMGYPNTPNPWLWCALGLSVGLGMMLWGASELPHTTARKTALGGRLSRSADRWFPIFLFMVEYTFAITILLVLWFTLQDLGFPSGGWLTVVLVSILVLNPARRIAQEASRAYDDLHAELWSNILAHVRLLLAAVFLAVALTTLLGLMENAPNADLTPITLLIWVPSLLAMLGCIVLVVHDVATYRGGGRAR